MLDLSRPGSVPPAEAEVGGARVAIARPGWRDGVALERLDRSSSEGRVEALMLLFSPDGERLPRAVAEDPRAALEAGYAWHDSAYGALPYGTPGPRRRAAARRALDWDADAAAVSADFLRLYRIDLARTASDDLDWRLFVALALSAARTPGSLLSQALSARAPLPPGASRAERDRHARLAEAWALPPTDAEMREMARARF